MPITSRYNQYQGINPHLNSYLQNTRGAWQSFHASHIIKIADLLNRELRAFGYYALPEQSLQIKELTLSKIHYPKPDTTIQAKPQTISPPPSFLSIPTRIEPVLELFQVEEDAQDYLSALLVYYKNHEAVCRLELLSPTNKPHRAGFKDYQEKRRQAIASGIPLVEIDYLHQSPPILRYLPSYAHSDPDSSPYVIIIHDPRPTLETGVSKIYPFEVDHPIPAVQIPLRAQDLHLLNLQVAYNETFEVSPFYEDVADYEQLPLEFNTYQPADQARIRARMERIAYAIQQGEPLTQTPLAL